MKRFWLLLLATLIFFISFNGCGSSNSTFSDEPLLPVETDADTDAPFFPPSLGVVEDASYCKNLQCKQQLCSVGATTVSGTVYDPAGKNPLYNVIVYVPNAPLDSFPSGVQCNKCSSPLSGEPLVTTLTDVKGNFFLKNVPVGQSIPLVFQIGKWRRVVKVDTAACSDVVLDKELSRLPKNKSEGDIPQFALTTGAADALECLLRKVGIDDSEFTNGSGTGRVHIFKGFGGGTLTGGVSDAQTFWSSLETLKRYDVVLLSCEGAEHAENKTAPAPQALFDYTIVGGRVFASHYHYYWFQYGVQSWNGVAVWNHQPFPPNPLLTNLDTSFPKGQAFSDWLSNVGGLTQSGQLSISEARNDVESVNAFTSQQWIFSTNPKSVQYFTFNTPVGQQDQCGRIVFSDLHVGAGDKPGQTFPQGCITTDLTPQQKALEFMLFDLSSCVQADSEPPKPPTVK